MSEPLFLELSPWHLIILTPLRLLPSNYTTSSLSLLSIIYFPDPPLYSLKTSGPGPLSSLASQYWHSPVLFTWYSNWKALWSWFFWVSPPPISALFHSYSCSPHGFHLKNQVLHFSLTKIKPGFLKPISQHSITSKRNTTPPESHKIHCRSLMRGSQASGGEVGTSHNMQEYFLKIIFVHLSPQSPTSMAIPHLLAFYPSQNSPST